jgi:hypothetical protein
MICAEATSALSRVTANASIPRAGSTAFAGITLY